MRGFCLVLFFFFFFALRFSSSLSDEEELSESLSDFPFDEAGPFWRLRFEPPCSSSSLFPLLSASDERDSPDALNFGDGPSSSGGDLARDCFFLRFGFSLFRLRFV